MYFWLMMAVAALLVVSGLVIMVRRPTSQGDPRRNGLASILLGVALAVGFLFDSTAALVVAIALAAVAFVLFAWTLVLRRRVSA